MIGHINAVYGSDDWTPITYLYNSLPVEDLSALYIAADICLVTSLRDGMNLVCKDYIASKAQDYNGVLILSEFAGAAKELSETIQINPNAIEDIMQAMHLAIYMPKLERQQRMRSKLFFARLHELKREQEASASRKMQGATLQKLIDKFQQA